MSRNQHQGRYAGKLQGKHYRTRGVNVSVSTLDCHLEVMMKEQQRMRKLAKTVMRDIPALRVFARFI